MLFALGAFLGLAWAQTPTVERFEERSLHRHVERLAIDPEDRRGHIIRFLSFTRPLGGYSPDAHIQQVLHRLVGDSVVELFNLRFIVVARGARGGWAVQCVVSDWQERGYLQVEDCAVTHRDGSGLSATEREQLSPRLSRLGPHYFDIIPYEELEFRDAP